VLEAVLIRGGEVLAPQGWTRADVVVADGRIRRIARRQTGSARIPLIVDASGARVLPGLIDLHINGCDGKSFATATTAEIAQMAQALAGWGVTGMLATVITLPGAQTAEALSRIREAAGLGGGAQILGAHLEGPFLNPERAGFHRAEWMRRPNLVEFTKLVTAGEDVTRMVTVAPEIRGAVSLIAAGVKRGVTMAVGHSSAGREEMEEAVRAGATVVTHVYNAMSAFHHREENVLSTALIDDRLTATCIYDRHHLSRAAMQILLRCKPADRVALVSDATAGPGNPEGALDVAGMRLEVRGGKVTARESGQLAGSAVPLLECVRHVVEDLDLPLERAWRMASAVPARVLGLEGSKGAAAPGNDADLVVLDERWHIRATLVKGRVVHGDRHQG